MTSRDGQPGSSRATASHPTTARRPEQRQVAVAGASPAATRPPSPAAQQPRASVTDLLLAPLGFLWQLSPLHLAVAGLLLALVLGILYHTANSDLFGLAAPDFDALTISDSYEQIESEQLRWQIVYESTASTRFAGIVRHVSPIRIADLPFATHDILVTSGDYANAERVRTSVVNHHFTYRPIGDAELSGTINLLHTIPANEDVYRQLLTIHLWDQVIISGREILSISIYSRDGQYRGQWRDSGCNSLLVESVTVVEP